MSRFTVFASPPTVRWSVALLAGCLVALALAPMPVAGQTTTGTIRGYVRDAGGAPLEAQVTARDVAMGVTRGTLSNANGFYNLGGLRPATYEVSIRRIGFGPQSRTVTVQIGQTLTVDFSMAQAATQLTAVTVTAEPAIETRTSEVATNVTEVQIENLPSADRNFLDLAALAPGVTLQGTRLNDTRRTITAGAQGAEQINVFIDGASYKNDILKGGVAGQDASRGNPFPRNAVQEFRIITQNYRAEYQKASSAIITATTKSGTNEWTGNAFFNYQNKGLVSLDHFQRLDEARNPNGFAKADYARRLAGFSLGGPIARDRIHFFGSYEGNYQSRSNRVNIDTTGMGAFPALDTIDFAARNGFFPSPFKSTLGFAKLTFSHTPQSSFELSLNTRHENDIRDFGGYTTYETATRFKNDVNTGILKHSYTRGTLLNEALVSYQHYRYNPVPASPGPINRLFGPFSSGCCAQIGSNVTIQDFTQQRLALRNDITWSGLQVAGEHVMKGGGNIDFLNYDIIKRNSEIPRFVFEPWWHSFEIPERVEFQTGDPNFKTSNNQIGLYIQDDWTPMPRLTLNLGIRWDYESGMLNYDYVTPQNVRDSLTKYADRLIGIPLDPDRYFTDGDDREPYKGSFQPRLGLSYEIDQRGRTTVFGGWGIFTDRTLFDQAIEERFALQHPSYVIRFRRPGDPDPGRVDFDPAFLQGRSALDALVASGTANTPEVKLLPNDLRPPSSEQFTFGVRQLVGSWGLEAAYTGVRSENVFTFYFANMNFTCADRNFGCFQVNSIPGFSTILFADNAGETWYDAIQIKADRPFRLSEGPLSWGVGLAYTGAKRQTKGFNDDFSFPNPVDYPKELRNDERHRVVTNWILQSPRAWDVQFSGVLTLGSGQRVDIGDRFGRPSNRLMPAALTPPSFTNVDLRLRKDFAFLDNSLAVTLDMFNAFNNQNFGCFRDFTFSRTDPNFGRPNCMISDPQRVQLGMEIGFRDRLALTRR